MQLVKIGAAALNQTPLDWDGNGERIAAALDRARGEGVSLLCLPEMCLSGYGCEDMFHGAGLRREARRLMRELLPHTAGLATCFGLPVLHGGALYNCMVLAADGRLVGISAKQHLAGDGLHYEPRWFEPWSQGTVDTARLDGEELPIGDLVYALGDVRVGMEICEDAWVPDRPGAQLARRGADILLNPSASHFAFGKQARRERYVREGSRGFAVAYVYCGPVGNEAGRSIYDGGNLIASEGERVAAQRRFSFADVELTVATVDIDANRQRRRELEGFHPQPGPDPGRVEAGFQLPAAPSAGPAPALPAWERAAGLEYEEFTRAIALGLFDYARKSHTRGFVVSLSGGADSAAVATLVHCMVQLGLDELGPEGFATKFGWTQLADRSPRDMVSALLTTTYQATRNSGPVTRAAAAALAAELGATHHELDVQPLVDGYRDLAEGALGRPLSWEADDIALQNIQARVRAPSAWMLANLEGKLLLSTGNRSEAAVGYATMDGDTAGGIAPIAGIDKHFLRGWLRWMEATGPEGIGPVPALAAVNAQAPTAELRPPERGQTDEGDLMPYDRLDRIEDLAIGARLAPVEVLERMLTDEPGADATGLADHIERFFTLWVRNQWKRERYAPSFHVDDRNLDPRSWCRFPILSGGYRRELAQMREWLDDRRA